MKLLVVGGGGREHAIIRSLKKNPEVTEIFACPGNGGMAADATCVNIGATEIEKIVAFAVENVPSIRIRLSVHAGTYFAYSWVFCCNSSENPNCVASWILYSLSSCSLVLSVQSTLYHLPSTLTQFQV